MIFGDCDNNVLLINALQYTIYAYSSLSVEKQKKTEKRTKKQQKL